jgi:phage terminase large subunit-like protein
MPAPGVDTREGGKWHLYFLAARDAGGQPTFPEVWDDARLKSYEHDKNLYYWAQMMNDPSSSEYTPITRAKIDELMCEMKDVPRNLRYTVHMDTAFKTPTRQSRGDESVIQVWGHSRDGSGDVYFIEGHSSNVWRAEDFYRQLVGICQRLKASGKRVVLMTDEKDMGGAAGLKEAALRSAFNAAHNMPMPHLVLLNRGDKKKIGRIIQAASFWAEGFVHLPRTAPGVSRLIDQMSRIGSSAHDDWSDTASDVFHEEVYHPLRGTLEDKQPPFPSRPGDDRLKSGINNENAMKLYDRLFDRNEKRPYEPV